MLSAQQKTEDIIITYYVNPNLFWFKYDDSSSSEGIKKLDTKIQRYGESVNKKQISEYSPFIDELVIVRHLSGSINKWLRARVDHAFKYQTGTEFILWALDYGFPLRSTSRWIRKLESRDLQEVENTNIFKGGLIGVPAALEFNFLTYKHEQVKKLMWSEKAIISTEELLFDAETLTFCCETIIKGHRFGDVLVKLHSGKSTTLSKYLRKLSESVEKSNFNFETEYQSLIHKPYWEYNQHNIFKIQENNFKVSYDDNSEMLHSNSRGKSTDEELSRKMSDWDRRNAQSPPEINRKLSDWEERNFNSTTHNNCGSSKKEHNDLAESRKLNVLNEEVQPLKPFALMSVSSRVDSLNDKMKTIHLSQVPMNKRYAYTHQQKPTNSSDEKQKQKFNNQFEEKVARIERKNVVYPAGYRF